MYIGLCTLEDYTTRTHISRYYTGNHPDKNGLPLQYRDHAPTRGHVWEHPKNLPDVLVQQIPGQE